jgi:hypothetical protein
MLQIPTVLCVFDSEAARQTSCFNDADATWIDRTDHGRCRYVSVVLDLDEPDAGHLQSIAAIVIVHPDQLNGRVSDNLGQWLAALDDHDVPVDLLAANSPVTFYAWLNRHAPRMLRSFRQDGEVHPTLPSWWRGHAEHHLANPGSHGTAEDDHSTGQFSLDVVKRYLATRHQRS